MDRPARRSPTPAAVLTAVALGVLTSTYALMSWNDALDQAAAGDYPWPLDPSEVVRSSVGWTLAVVLVCAVTWVATARQSGIGRPWRVPATAIVGIAVWSLAAWGSLHVSYLVDGWYVPWPGPVPVTAYVTDPTDPLSTVLAVRPGALTPVILAAAVLAVGWSGRRHARSTPAVEPVRRRRHAVVLGVLGPPIVAAVAAATLLQVDADPYYTTLQRTVDVLVSPGSALVAAVVAALALGGTGRAGWVLLGVVGLAVVGPIVGRWWSGEADNLLATAALGTLAVVLAAAVHPAATAMSRLDDPEPWVPDLLLVPERADADDRARA